MYVPQSKEYMNFKQNYLVARFKRIFESFCGGLRIDIIKMSAKTLRGMQPSLNLSTYTTL